MKKLVYLLLSIVMMASCSTSRVSTTELKKEDIKEYHQHWRYKCVITKTGEHLKYDRLNIVN